MLSSKFLRAFLVLIIFVASADAQTADEIVAKYVEAIGGQSALDSIQTLKVVRDFRHVEENRTERGTYYYMRPDFYRFEAGNGLTCIVVSGGKSWRKTRESADEPWKQWEQIDHRIPFCLDWLGPFLDHQKRGIELEYIGRENIDCTDIFHLKMKLPGGRTRDLYFDTETSLYFGNANQRISDYRPVGDILFPFRTEGKHTLPDGKTFHSATTIIDVEINLPLDESLFAPEQKQ